ncbi:MAG: C1 family peptidase [Paludibacteraceae bacterium]|nr:C1 family peptidase [Paludibacteraceae bacterium]
MKKHIATICILWVAGFLSAQTITPELLNQLQASYQGNAHDRAIENALGQTPINNLIVNQANLLPVDHHFTYRVPQQGITNQKKSGRCWLFCGLNIIRADIMRHHDIKELELSEAYLFFYDQLEKSNFFLENIISTRKLPADSREVDYLMHNPIGDGGGWTGVTDLVAKYGLVPNSCMQERLIAENTAQYRPIIQTKLKEFALEIRDSKASDKAIRQRKEEMLQQIYRILCLCLGTPPTEFTWAQYGKKDTLIGQEVYTPQSWAKKYLRQDIVTDYVMMMNDPTRPYYQLYSVALDRHVLEGTNWCYVNVPVEDMAPMAIASLKDSVAMYTGTDVSKFRDMTRGILDINNYDYESLFGMPFPMDKAQRVRTFSSGSAHAMSLVAVDLDKDGQPIKWLLENSWGDNAGWKGHLIMTNEWMQEYLFRLIVEKKYASDKVLQALQTKPVELPMWDPMASFEQ